MSWPAADRLTAQVQVCCGALRVGGLRRSKTNCHTVTHIGPGRTMTYCAAPTATSGLALLCLICRVGGGTGSPIMHERWTPIFQHLGFAGRARASQGRPEGLGELSVLARGPCSCLLQQGCLWRWWWRVWTHLYRVASK